jgi:hypothetical protein
MKKVIALAGVLIAVLVFAILYQFRPIGLLDFNAYVLEDNTVPQNLNAEVAEDDALLVEPSRFDIFSPLYELAGDLFIGEEKAKPNPALPIFANDGSALMLVNNSAKLVDSDFERLSTFRGQFVSNGAAYNPDRSRSDPETILLVSFSGGLYSNAMDVTVTANGARTGSGGTTLRTVSDVRALSTDSEDSTAIAMNSVLRFSKSEIAYYELEDGTFRYKKITGLNENSDIRLGDLEMNYHEFLRRLGLLRDSIIPVVDEEEEEEEPEFIPTPSDQEVMPAVPNNPYEVPQVSLGAMRPFVNEGFARGRLHVSDRAASIDSNITIYIKGLVHDYQNTFTQPLSEFTGRQTFSVNVDFPGLSVGSDYEVYGEYWYKDTSGVRHYVRFGDQVFRFEPSDRPAKVQNYVEPTVSVNRPLGSTVYYITTTQKVNDPAARIVGGVRYEITRVHPNNDPLAASTLYTRKYAAGSGDFKLGVLPPGELYRVHVFYIFRNAYNEEISVDLFTEEVWTRPLSDLEPLKINYTNGQLYSNKIALENASFDTTVAQEALEAIDRLELRLWKQDSDPNPYPSLASPDLDEDASAANNSVSRTRINGTPLKDMRRGQAQVLQTANNLAASTYFNYYFTAYDRFGNQLVIQDPYAGNTHTCKALPYAEIRTVENVVGKNSFAITTNDSHDALLPTGNGNLLFKIFDLEGNLVSWYRSPYVKGDPSFDSSPLLFPLDETISVTGLAPATSYRAQVFGDYDIDDGNGPQNQALIGSLLFRTPNLSTLGNLMLDSSMQFGYPTASKAIIDSVIDISRTSVNLLDLLESVSVGVYREDDPDQTIVETITFTREDVDPTMWNNLLSGNLALTPAVLEFCTNAELDSKTDYLLSNSAQIRIVETLYEVKASNTLTRFKTLRKTPLAVIPSGGKIGFTNALYLFQTFVDDPDEAVVNGRVTLRVTDLGELLHPDDPNDLDVVPPGKNQIVALEILTAKTDVNDVEPVDIILRELDEDHLFKIEYIASEYNIGFTNATYQTNVRLSPRPDTATPKELEDGCYYATTRESLSGKLNLVGMDSIVGDSDHLATSIKTTIDDVAGDLVNNRSYTLRFYKRPGYGDYVPDADNFYNGEKVVPLTDPGPGLPDLYEITTTDSLDYFYEYRVELWVQVNNGSQIMLDKLEFDTDGPMILIGPNYAYEYYMAQNNPTEANKHLNPAEDLRLLDPSPTRSNFQSLLPVWAPRDPNNPNIKLGGCEARYLVITDLVYDQNYNNNDGAGVDYFRGSIDFQGHKLSISYVNEAGSTSPRRQFMWGVGARGVIKNLVYEIDFTGVDPTTYNSLVQGNSGKITNIQATVKGWSDCYNWSTGVITGTNGTTGIVENFAVNLADDVSIRNGFGTVAYSNSGVIRSGYVYSLNDSRIRVPVVPNNADQKFNIDYIGGIAGINEGSGRIYDVFSLVDIAITVNDGGASGRTLYKNRIGTVVGYNNNGEISDSYSSVTKIGQSHLGGNVYFDGSLDNAKANGPAIGGTARATRTLAYYYNNTNTVYDGSRPHNASLGLNSLRDYIWQRDLLGSAFNAEKMVAGGFYPQLNWPYNMPKQPYLTLPDYTSASSITLSSVMVEQQYEEYAIVLATFRNPAFYVIRGLTIDGLGKVEALGDQTNVTETGISYMRFKVSNPSQYRSSYQTLEFTYRLLNSQTDVKATGDAARKTLNAEFYRPINTAEEWVTYLNAPTRDLASNYRLKADIDLRTRGITEIYIGDDANRFTGRLDAGIYNSEYELVGIRTVTLPTMEGMVAKKGALVPRLAGAISNMQVDGMRITSASTAANNGSSVGLVAYSEAGASLDNVHINGAYLKSYYFAGGLVAESHYTNITNCSVNNITIEDAGDDFYSGGLVGYATDATFVSNCYVAGLDTTLLYSTLAKGSGGLIGRLDSGEVQNVYTEGRIESTQNAYVGGLIGFMTGSQIVQHFWSRVEIQSNADGVGAVFGTTTNNPGDLVPTYGLAVGNVSSSLEYANNSTTRPVRRFIGNKGGASTSGTEGAVPDGFFWASQLVNGKLYEAGATAGGPVALMDGAKMLTNEDLRSRQTWMMTMRFGNGFEYNAVEGLGGGVANEYLPLLLSTTGTLLPYQTPVLLGLPEYRINVLDTFLLDGTYYDSQIEIYHPEGMRPSIRGLEVEYMNIYPGMEGTINSRTFESHFTVNASGSESKSQMTFRFYPDDFIDPMRRELDRYVDTYRISALMLDNGSGGYTKVPVQGQIVFTNRSQIPYRPIVDVAAWQTAMETHGTTAENFSINGYVNFAAQPADTIRTNLIINRLRGASGASPKYGLYNLNLDLPGSTSLIKLVKGGIDNLSFENVTMRINGGNYNGIIGMLQGSATNIDVRNFNLDATPGNYNGVIGWMKGSVSNVTLAGFKVRSNGGQNTGGFVGYALDTTMTNVRVNIPAGSSPGDWPGKDETQDGDFNALVDGSHSRNPNFVRGYHFAGAIAGRLERGSLRDCSGSYLTVYGTGNYTGGLVGYSNATQNISNINVDNQVSQATVYGSGAYTGGIFGHASRLCGTSFVNGGVDGNGTPNSGVISVADSIIIGKGERTGGIVGGNGDYFYCLLVSNTQVYGTNRVGGVAGAFGYGRFAFVRNSIISSTRDDLYTTNTTLPKDAAGVGSYFGGITGGMNAYLRDSGVVDSTIGSLTSSQLVGGVIGATSTGDWENRERLYSKNCIVNGTNHVGGIIGRHERRAAAYCISDATVTGSGQYVGGIVGSMLSSQSLYGSGTARVTSCIYSGTVTGANWVAGIVGRTEGELYPFITGSTRGSNMMNGRCHMLGRVVVNSGTDGDLLWNLDPNVVDDNGWPEQDAQGVDTGNRLYPIRPIFNRVLGSATLTMQGNSYTATQYAASNTKTETGIYERAMYYYGTTDVGQQTDASLDTYRVRFSNWTAGSQGEGVDWPKRDVNPLVVSGDAYNPQNRTAEWNALAGTLVYNSNHYQLAWDHPGSTDFTIRRAGWIYRFGSGSDDVLPAYNQAGYHADGNRITSNNSYYYGRLTNQNANANPFVRGYLPYPAMDNAQSPFSEGAAVPGTYLPASNNISATHNNAGTAAFTGGFVIPSYVPDGVTLFSVGGATALIEGEANLDAYAVGADKLNLEFAAVTPDTEFVVLQARGGSEGSLDALGDAEGSGEGSLDALGDAEGSEDAEDAEGAGAEGADAVFNLEDYEPLFQSSLEQRTYTFNYDFTTPLTVLVSESGTLTSFAIDPVGMRRSILVEGDTLYHITASGVQSSASGLLPGTYLHLQNGEALAEGGVVFNLATGSIARHIGAFALADGSPLPLFSGTAEGVTLKTFKNYTVVANDATQPMRILVSDGALFPVDPALPVVFDAVLAGVRSAAPAEAGDASDGDAGGAGGAGAGGGADAAADVGGSYLTVLDDEGTIVDTQSALTYPEKFSASGVAEMTNNLATDAPLVMVRYTNGKVVAFNYFTGEPIDLADAAGGESFADYVSRFFRGEEVVSKLAGLATGYQDLATFKDAVEQGLISEGHIGPNLGSDAEQSAGPDAEGRPLIDGQPLVPDDGAIGGGSANVDGSASGGEDGGAAAAAAAASDGSTGGGGGGGGAGEDGASAAADGSDAGDLAKPTPGTKTVAMFNYAEGLYELFDQEQLLSGSRSTPLASMDSANLLEVSQITTANGAAAAQQLTFDSAVKSGIPQFITVILAIGVLLVVLFVRRGRLNKR